MPLALKDRVQETSTTVGTGAYALAGAVTGFQSFSVIGNGNTTYYAATDGTDWEVGIGTYTASGTTLSRDTILESSNSGNAVNWGAGTKNIFVTYPAERANTAQIGDIKIASSAPDGPGTWLETGKYYSKATYPALASVVGDVPDIRSNVASPQAQLPVAYATTATVSYSYITATDGATTVAVGASGAIRITTDGSNWVPVPSGTTNAFNELRYLNSNFVAVGASGTLVTSSNGTDWNVRASRTTAALTSVAFGNTRYVAVGASGAIIYSTDLVTWTLATGTGSTQFNRVVYANSIFVAVGNGGVTYTSTDGITWTLRTFQTTALVDLTYANSLFVAITSAGTPYYSADGIVWNSQYLPFSVSTSNIYQYITATDGTTTVVVGSSGAIRKTTDGTNWSPVSSNTTQSLNAVSYINSNFVAVGNTGTIVTSSDGTTWTSRTSGTTNILNSVAFGNTRYVVVGASGTIIYSTDLAAWTLATGTGSNEFNRVIYANNLFVAVGVSGACFTSSDGITWTSRSAGATTFRDIIYDNSLFVAVGNGGVVYTSSDGTTWTSRSAGTTTFLKVIYANSLFVAVGSSGVIYTSANGITWTSRVSGILRTLTSVTWNGSDYVAVAESASVYLTSPDGVTWTANADISVTAFYSVAVINNKTIAFGINSSVIIAGATRAAVLQNGIWPYTVLAQDAPNPRVIAYNGSNQYVAVGSSGVILTSSDAQTWAAQSSPISGALALDKVQYVNGNYIAMGSSDTNLMTSPNGTTWTIRTAGSTRFNAAAFGASTYVVVGGGGAIFSSADLITWTSRSAGVNPFYDVLFANSIFVAIGASNSVYSSTDGATWTLRTATGTWNRIIYANSQFVMVGNTGAIATSSDGITWTTRTSNVSGNLNDIVWNGSIYCAVGASGVVTTSSDGVTWTSRNSGSTATLVSISWDGSSFVVTNTDNSTVLVSPNGISWTPYPTQFGGSFLYNCYLGGKFIAIGTSKIATSTNGTVWTAADPVQFTAIPGMSVAYTVTYSNNTFIISGLAASAANIATSTDGINWTGRFVGNQPTTISQAWHYALWNGSAYYLVGANGRYATSSDAATWTVTQDVSASSFFSVAVVNSRTIAFGNNSSVILAGASRAEVLQNGTWAYTVVAQNAANPRTIAYNGSNQYVAVGSSGVILTSSDGQTWTGRYSGVTTNFDKVQYVNSNYIAMGGSGAATNLLTSSDGTTWTTRSAGAAVFNAAAFGASTYVVVGASGSVFSSTDLTTWTSRSAGANAFNDVLFANSIFVAVGASNSVYSSTDGATWTLRTATGTWNRIIYANNLFVIVGNTGAIATSSDGITWTVRTSNVSGNLNDIVWNGSIYCAVGASGVITTSPNGVTWTARTPGDTSVTLLSISWSGTRFIVTNSTNGVVWTSTDGITWTRVSTAFRGTTLYNAYLGNRFVAVGPNYIQSSTDSLTWKTADHVQYVVNGVNKLYKLGSYYYACTGSGLFQSSDGIAFTPVREAPPVSILSMAYSGSAWLAVSSAASGQPQAFYKSTNGTTWSKSSDFGTLTSTSTLAGAALDLVYANGNFISSQTITTAQNVFQGIYTSSDGVTWTGRALPFNATPSGPMASDGTNAYVVINVSPLTTFKSTDGGVTWNALVVGGNPIYSNGYLINSIAATADGSTFAPNVVNFATGIYVYQNYAFTIPSTTPVTRQISNLKTGVSNTYPAIINSLKDFNYTPAGTIKEWPTRGGVLLIPSSSLANPTNVNLIGEVNLRSYDTATTFWVPFAGTAMGQTAYIYAGP